MIELSGNSLVGHQEVKGDHKEFHAINPATDEVLQPVFFRVTKEIANDACELAWSAFRQYRNIDPKVRADFLDKIASEIEALSGQIIERAVLETGLPKLRIEGECGRTCNQLRLFSDILRKGDYEDVRIDAALLDRKPFPRPDLRFRRIGLGPVAVFGASNFPLAFSVAGGDTASALAAGCPVVVKAHSAHPGTSELVGRAVQKAVRDSDMPEGVFSMLHGSGREIGTALAAHPRIKAIGFTGSRSGGTALIKVAQSRKEPIPVYAEMSSINPVYLLPGALLERAEGIATAFVGAQQMGAGQFCTSPGLILALESHSLDRFIDEVATELSACVSQTMLTPGIFQAFDTGINALEQSSFVKKVARAKPAIGANQGQGGVFVAKAEDFLIEGILSDEVFGSCTLILRCKDVDEMIYVTQALEGQLTAAIHSSEQDHALAKKLLDELELKVGRILFNGFGTGVEVCQSMVHGGPFPATSDSRMTSVGGAAIERFLRPVCYQSVPSQILPSSLKV